MGKARGRTAEGPSSFRLPTGSPSLSLSPGAGQGRGPGVSMRRQPAHARTEVTRAEAALQGRGAPRRGAERPEGPDRAPTMARAPQGPAQGRRPGEQGARPAAPRAGPKARSPRPRKAQRSERRSRSAYRRRSRPQRRRPAPPARPTAAGPQPTRAPAACAPPRSAATAAAHTNDCGSFNRSHRGAR